MTTDDFKPKLTAILSAGVEGYRRFMEKDGKSTVRTLTTNWELMGLLAQKARRVSKNLSCAGRERG